MDACDFVREGTTFKNDNFLSESPIREKIISDAFPEKRCNIF